MTTVPEVVSPGTSAGDGRDGSARRPLLGWAAAAAVAVTAAGIVDDYTLFELSRIATTAPAVAGLVLLTGRGGQVSAGQGALFGTGAYACAVLAAAGWPWPAAVLGAVAVSGAVGLLLGVPAVRLRGLSLAMVTLATAVIFPLVMSRWEGLTGGPAGLAVRPVRAPGALGLSDAQFLYLVAVAALAATLGAAAWWARGRTGRALAALRTDPAMARAQGIDTASLTVAVTGIAAAMSGLGGGLNVLVVQAAIPDSYTFALSLALFTGAVVGGIGSWAGAVVGAAFVVHLPQLASDVVGPTTAGQWSQVGYAVTLLIAVYAAPGGIVGTLSTAVRRRRGRARPRRASGPDEGG